MSNIGYTRTLTVQIQRSKHRIGFRAGTRVEDLIALLKQVPAGSQVDEVIDLHEDEPGVVTIEFHEESKVDG
jgi:hypothetical protein